MSTDENDLGLDLQLLPGTVARRSLPLLSADETSGHRKSLHGFDPELELLPPSTQRTILMDAWPAALRFLTADLSAPGFDFDGLVRTAAAVFGRLDHLVNCAALVDARPLHELTPASVAEVLAVNVAAPLLLSAAAARRLAGRPPISSIVNISSVAERFRGPDSLAYEASKAALSQLTRGLAHDLAPDGTRVNAVAPGAIDTERKASDPTWDVQVVGKLVPLGRTGEPADVAGVVAASGASTGWTMPTLAGRPSARSRSDPYPPGKAGIRPARAGRSNEQP